MSNLARPCGEFYSADRPAIPTESEGDIEFNDVIDDDINLEFLQESEPLGGQRSTKEETWNSPSATTYEYGQHLDKAGDNQSVAFQNDHEQQNYIFGQKEGLLDEDRNYSTGNHNSSSDASTMADLSAIPTESEGDIEFNDVIDDDINLEFLQESEPLGGQRSTKEETWNSPSATTYEYGQHLDKAGDNQSVAFQNDHEQQNYIFGQKEGLLDEDRNYSTGNHNSSSDASTIADLSAIPTESEGDIEFNDVIDDDINLEFLQESEPLGGQRSTKEETWNSPSATTYEYGQHLDKAGDNQSVAFQNDHEQQNYIFGQKEGLLDEDRNYSTGNHNSSSDASSMADNSQRGLGFHNLPPDHQDFSHNNDQMEEPAVHVDSQERSQDHEEDQNTQSLESEREVFEASGHHAEVQNNQKTGPVVVEWHSFQNKIYHSYSSFRKTYVILGYDSELPRRIITRLEARTWQKVNGQKEVINCSTMLEWTRKDSTSIYTLTSKPTTSQQTLFKTTGKRAICSAKVVPGNRIILTYEWKPTNGFLLFRPEDKETNSFGVSLLYSLDSAGTLCDLDINTPLHILSKLEGTKRKRHIPEDHRIEHEQMQERVKRYCRGA